MSENELPTVTVQLIKKSHKQRHEMTVHSVMRSIDVTILD